MNSVQANNFNNKKGSQLDLLQFKEKEKYNFNNINKTLDIEENNDEKILHNNNSNSNIYYYKEIDNQNMFKLKLNENTSSRMNINNKGSFIKRFNNINEENNLYNFNDYNLKKYNNKRSAKNKVYFGLPNKQSKLILFEHNKNFGSFNNNGVKNNLNKEINFSFKNQNDLVEIKEIFLNKINKDKNYNKNSNNFSRNKKKISSVEIKHKQEKEKFKLKDYNEEKKYYNNQRNLTNKNYLNDKEYNSMKEYLNRSMEEVQYKIIQNNEMNQNDLNSLNNNDKSENSKNISEILNNINNINKKNKELKIKSLSIREKSYYILAKSNILNLKEKIIFSQANKKIRSLISIKDIKKIHESFIKDKIKELEEKIINYNEIIETHFTPSKTAIISLNIIKKEDENNFKNFLVNSGDLEEKEKNYYFKYIELLYILLKNSLNENNIETIDINTLYNELNKKGFKSCKDFLYEIFISQKTLNAYDSQKMDKFSEIFDELPDFIKHQGEIKNNRFISFSYFLLHEIYIYWNKLKEFLNLKGKAQFDIECLKKKISRLSNIYK